MNGSCFRTMEADCDRLKCLLLFFYIVASLLAIIAYSFDSFVVSMEFHRLFFFFLFCFFQGDNYKNEIVQEIQWKNVFFFHCTLIE